MLCHSSCLFNATPPTQIYTYGHTLALHDARPISLSIAVAVILFVGGLSLDFRELRKTEGAVTRLVVLGVPIAWIIGALACYYVAGLVWPVAILFAGILVVPGPTVVIPLFRQSSIAPSPRAHLKWQ